MKELLEVGLLGIRDYSSYILLILEVLLYGIGHRVVRS